MARYSAYTILGRKDSAVRHVNIGYVKRKRRKHELASVKADRIFGNAGVCTHAATRYGSKVLQEFAISAAECRSWTPNMNWRP